MEHSLLIAKSSHPIGIDPIMANRHGLIAGATGTGKTVTLRVLAERFSDLGVPVFMADIKGDLSGIAVAGTSSEKLQSRIDSLGITDFSFRGYPTTFWDVFGTQGHPVRTTISELGPVLLSRILGLNETQSGLLTLIFKVADDQGLLLLDLKDLRAMAQFVGEQAAELRTQYGNISPASIGAIQRGLLGLESEAGDAFFGEPALTLDDLLQTDSNGRGMINILSASKLMHTPKLYTTFLLWLLSELFEQLPEAGDVNKPKLVFFFDEAHLLFNDIPKPLLDKIEQVVRLIRSKGVGVYFITQSPTDIPDNVLGQLGNRVQHALRAFTPKDQKAVRAAAQTFRANAGVDVETAITELGVGEALVSVLDHKGIPTPVERAFIYPPHSRFLPLDPSELQQQIRSSPIFGHYEQLIDRESAYEKLRAQVAIVTNQQAETAPETGPADDNRSAGSIFGALAKSAARAVGSQIGREIVRGILGAITGSKPRRR